MLDRNKFAATCSVCRVGYPAYGGWRSNTTGFWQNYCEAHKPDDNGRVATGEKAEGEAAELRAIERALATQPKDEPVLPPSEDLKASVAEMEAIFTRFCTETVPALAQASLERLPAMAQAIVDAQRTVSIQIAKLPAVKMDVAHKLLPTVLQVLSAKRRPFLVGPAGSGKTTLAEQCAKVLGISFHAASRVTSEFKLLGFIDAKGQVVRTSFREAFEKGGLFLLDEVDASDPDVLTSFNMALANRYCDFPDGMVQAHADFYAIAAGNTYGRGADRQYVGRNQLDAATLDRFVVLEVDYDEDLERQLAANPEWVAKVQRVRRAIELEKVRHIVSPRASMDGAALLAVGMAHLVVENGCIWKGLPADQRQRVETRMLSC